MNTEKLYEQGNAESCIKHQTISSETSVSWGKIPSVRSHYNRMNSDKRYHPAYLTWCILHKAYKKAMLAEGKETVAFFKYSRIYLMSLTNWRRTNVVFVNKIRIKKKVGSLAMTQWCTKGIKKEKATYEEYQKDVAEAKVNKPLNVASFWSATSATDSSVWLYTFIIQQDICVL